MLYFDYNKELINKVRQLPGSKWSANNKAWHIPFREDYLEYLRNQLPDIEIKRRLPEIKTQPVNKIQHSSTQQLLKNSKNKNSELIRNNNIKYKNLLKQEVKDKINLFYKYMRSKRYADQSIKTYTSILIKFFIYYKERKAKRIFI